MAIIHIKVSPGAKHNEVKLDHGVMEVYLTAPPVEGKANQALIDFLSDYYHVRKSAVTIIKGLKTRQKTVQIDG